MDTLILAPLGHIDVHGLFETQWLVLGAVNVIHDKRFYITQRLIGRAVQRDKHRRHVAIEEKFEGLLMIEFGRGNMNAPVIT